MSMRYLIRRPKPEDLSDIKSQIPDLDSKLPKAADNLRREIHIGFNPMRSALYMFMTRKSGADWIWTCPSIEFNTENEEGLFALCDKFRVPRPTHLAGAQAH